MQAARRHELYVELKPSAVKGKQENRGNQHIKKVEVCDGRGPPLFPTPYARGSRFALETSKASGGKIRPSRAHARRARPENEAPPAPADVAPLFKVSKWTLTTLPPQT